MFELMWRVVIKYRMQFYLQIFLLEIQSLVSNHNDQKKKTEEKNECRERGGKDLYNGS